MEQLHQFIVCTNSASHHQWLATALQNHATVIQIREDALANAKNFNTKRPELIFIDFSTDGEAPLPPPQAVVAARIFAQVMPEVPLIAIGSTQDAANMIAALRAGVKDFIDLHASDEEIAAITHQILSDSAIRKHHVVPEVTGKRGKLVVLLGARIGVGTSTLATHLAAVASQFHKNDAIPPAMANAKALPNAATQNLKGIAENIIPSHHHYCVSLLDLGLPVGDGLLYLGATGNFHIVEAIRNLSRFDETFVRAALNASEYDVPALTLPRDLSEMRTVKHSDSLALLDQLRRYFDLLVADLGGFPNVEFVVNMVRAANEVWIVCDQSVGAIVSLAERLNELEEHNITRESLRLIVNRYDERYGMSAMQIAQRFSVPLLTTIPDRTKSLVHQANLGHLLVKEAPNDPYVKSVLALVKELDSPNKTKTPLEVSDSWLSKFKLWK